VLQRILQRFCEVVLGHLQVVLRRDLTPSRCTSGNERIIRI